MAKCTTCGHVSSANHIRRQHCWKHKQCSNCHYLGMGGGSCTSIRPFDDFRRI